MPRMNVGEAIIETLRQEKVSHIFGIVGAAFLDVLDALYDKTDIQFVGVRHEQAAALMADGYARATGNPGVCIATNGPGILNLTFGVAAAYVGHSPVVVLAPAPDREHQNRGAIQEFDQVSLFRPITKASFQVNKSERIPEMIRHAFRVATSGKMGPVLVDLPRDLMVQTEIDVDLAAPHTYRTGQTRIQGDKSLVEEAARLLLSAERPIIMPGGGVQWSLGSQEVTDLADVLGAGMVTSYGRCDAVPNTHTSFLGHLGRLPTPEAVEAMHRADLLLAVGTRLSHSTSYYDNRYIQKDTKIIQIEIDPNEIGRNYPVAVGIEGDAKAVAGQILELVRAAEKPKNEDWNREVRDLAQKRLQRLDDHGKLDGTPMHPERIYYELRKVMPDDAIVVLDSGLNSNYGLDSLVYKRPRTLINNLDLAGLGFSFPEAIGAKFARPDATVVSINGDGGFLFNGQELETLVRHNLNVVTVVMNNGIWGSEKAFQHHAFGRYVGADIGNPRFDKYAEAFGARGYYVENPEDIGDVFKEAAGGEGPSIIEIPMDPNVLPVPARLSDAKKS